MPLLDTNLFWSPKNPAPRASRERILEKTIRPAQVIGKLKQEESRKAASKESSNKVEEADSEKGSSEN